VGVWGVEGGGWWVGGVWVDLACFRLVAPSLPATQEAYFPSLYAPFSSFRTV